MSSDHVSSERGKSLPFSEYWVVAVAVVLFLVAYYALLLLFFFLGLPDQPTPHLNVSSLQSRAGKAPPVEERVPASLSTAITRDPRPEVVGSVEPRIGLAPPQPRSGAVRPIAILFAAPGRVADGSTFEVSVGVPLGSGVNAAKIRFRYDDDALELLDMTDAMGTKGPLSPSDPGIVELNLERGARQAASIRFLARTGGPRSVQIALTAELWDQAGAALPSAAVDARTIIIGP